MEGDISRYVPGPEGAGIFSFIQELDFAYTYAVIIKKKFPVVVHRVPQFNLLPDIGGRNFIEITLETDRGIVIDHSFMADEEYLVQFGFGEPADIYVGQGGIVPLHGSLPDAGMELVVIIFIDPEMESLIELRDACDVPDRGKETLPDGSKKPFHLSTRWAIKGLRMDQGDAGQGSAFGQQI